MLNYQRVSNSDLNLSLGPGGSAKRSNNSWPAPVTCSDVTPETLGLAGASHGQRTMDKYIPSGYLT